MNLRFPFQLKFKVIPFGGQQGSFYDQDENEVMFAKQWVWKINEKIDIYSNAQKTKKLYEVRADRIFSPYYRITTPEGDFIGSIKRSGRITFRSYHQILDSNNEIIYKINEINFPDGLFSIPRYVVCGVNDPLNEVASLDCIRSFGGTLFQINGISDIPEEHKALILTSFVIIAIMLMTLDRFPVSLP